MARVDGVIGDTGAKIYYYHTDYEGSVRVITDQAGKVVFNADYFAFGTKYISNGDFDETHGFTGKEYDSDTGLYYFNARWYDPDLGRFLSEDPVANPNLYIYGNNNPQSFIDPDGRNPFLIMMAISALIGGIDSYSKGGSFWSGAFVGAVSGAVSWGISGAFGAAIKAAYGGFTLGTVMADSWTNGIAGMMVSGALGGGIMSAAMGGDFGEGAGRGALSGFLAWGANQMIPENYTINDVIKSKDPVGTTLTYLGKQAIAGGGNVSIGSLLVWAGSYVATPGVGKNESKPSTEPTIPFGGTDIDFGPEFASNDDERTRQMWELWKSSKEAVGDVTGWTAYGIAADYFQKGDCYNGVGWEVVGVLKEFTFLCSFGLTEALVGSGSMVSSEIATSKGVSVIGPRATYREFAKNIGANYLKVTDESWTWEKNLKFLQGVVKRGDDVIFAGRFNPKLLDSTSTLAKEINYLQRNGYKWNISYTKLIAPDFK